ncbi:MAG TPA: hypothetical protein VG738_14425 [Chitinophagaceae bacterium]|nr:hypothetical protein [Chitinophagaceae bacterium]
MKNIVWFLKKPVLPYIIIISSVIISFFYYHKHIAGLPSSDLGPKITSALAIAHKQPAYFEADGNMPKDSLTIVNGCTVTPFVLLLHYPLTALSNCSTKETWFIIQYLLFAACALFTIAFTPGPVRRYVQCFAFVAFFVYSQYWFIHLYAGQVHILYAFLFFLMYALKALKKEFLFGLVVAITIACRPLFLPAAIMLLIWRNRRSLQGLVTGFVLLFLFTVFTGSFSYWLEYSKAMKLYSLQMPAADSSHPEIKFTAPVTYFPPCGAAQADDTVILHKIAAGRPGGLARPLQSYLLRNNILITNTLFYVLISFTIIAIIIFFLRQRNRTISTEQLLCAFFIFYIITEICTPAPRGPYNYMLWLFGSFLIIAKGNYAEVLLLLLGLSLNSDHPYIHHGREWGEVLMMVAGISLILRRHKLPREKMNVNPFTIN